ncbi:MAG TPA: ATP-dependent DNA ligase [Patescibacteria group bacterium]|nr:ATP-dependent DNA ligase [Patescibacteria group bacterium]
MRLPFPPPLEPMLARPGASLPDGPGWAYEPKWDGFRAIVFRDGDELLVQSRDLRPLERYFPELEAPLRAALPRRGVVDGEIVIAGPRGLDFDALLLRIHPAESRIRLLAAETPASYVAWDLLAIDDQDLRGRPFSERRRLLAGRVVADVPGVHLTPTTEDRALATDWFTRFEGAGLDGVIAKRLDGIYEPGKRGWAKVKHARTADVAIAGFRWHKDEIGTGVGSLILGLHDGAATLHHVGVASGFAAARRRELVEELAPLRAGALEGHPWRGWATAESGESAGGRRMPGAHSRWNRGRDLTWEPLRVERVAEVAYDHLQGDRFRHATRFVRWRPDRRPGDCRYDQLETTPPYELADIFGAWTR